jgi:5-methyltetrahydropteroyltriglutamate--homocysteine methyltransferase
LPLLFAREDGSAVDAQALEGAIRSAVADPVRQQAEAGVDVVNDGEMGKISYASYVHDRLTGFEGQGAMPGLGDILEYPEFGQRVFQGSEEAFKHMRMLACNGPIWVKDHEAVKRDIANLKSATPSVAVEDVFLSAASPGVIALGFPNHYCSCATFSAAPRPVCWPVAPPDRPRRPLELSPYAYERPARD